MFEDTCKDGDSDAYKCVYVTLIVQSWQKIKSALLHTETVHAYNVRSVVCVSTAQSVVLKLQCLKTRDHATDVVPRLGTSWSFSTCFCLSFTPRGGWHVKIAVAHIMKRYYRKQCILWHHDINDRTYETIDFLFRPYIYIYIVISHIPRGGSVMLWDVSLRLELGILSGSKESWKWKTTEKIIKDMVWVGVLSSSMIATQSKPNFWWRTTSKWAKRTSLTGLHKAQTWICGAHWRPESMPADQQIWRSLRDLLRRNGLRRLGRHAWNL